MDPKKDALTPEENKQLDKIIDVDIEEAMHPELRWTEQQWKAYEKQQDQEEDRANDYD